MSVNISSNNAWFPYIHTFRFFFIDELTGFEINVFQVSIYDQFKYIYTLYFDVSIYPIPR